MQFTGIHSTPTPAAPSSATGTQGAMWRHDIGNWHSRKSYEFLQQQQQQRVASSVQVDAPLASTNAAVGPQGGLFSWGAQTSGATTRQQRPAVVTFDPTVVLPVNKGNSAAQEDRSHPCPSYAGGDDVNVSDLSSSPEDAVMDRTRPFDDSTQHTSNVWNTSSMAAYREQALDACAALWVTVYGVPPERMLDARAALDVQCGQTVTHVWPATSPQCNWMHVRFAQPFDAAKAVAASPITCTAISSGGVLTVGVEWCRSVELIQHLDAVTIARTAEVVASEQEGPALQSAGAASSFLSSLSSTFKRGSTSTRRSSPLSHSSSKMLRPPQPGNVSVVDATVGGCGIGWMSPSAWLDAAGSFMSRRLTPEQRLDRLVALTNQQFRTLRFVAQNAGSPPLLVVFSSSSPLFVWVNIVNFLSCLATAFVIVAWLFCLAEESGT